MKKRHLPFKGASTLTAAVTAALALALAGCGGGGSSSGAAASAGSNCKSVTTIKIGTTPYQDSLLMTVGQQLGWYQKACLNVSFDNVAWGNEMSVLTSGTDNVVWYNDNGTYLDYHLDKNLVYFYPWDEFYNGITLMGRANSNLKTYDQFVSQGMSAQQAITAVLKELHGKQVITTLDNNRAEAIQAPLVEHNFPLSWVKYINENAASGLALFLRGTGDAYIAGIPQRQELVNDGYKILLSGTQLVPAGLNGFQTTKSFYAAHKQAMLALLNITFMEVRYTDANLNQVAAYVSSLYQKQTGLPFSASAFKQYWQKLELYPTDAAQAQQMVFDPNGKAYWKTEWDLDETYYVNMIHAISAPAPTSAFIAPQVQKDYIAEYGANQTGWWKPTGTLSS